MTAAATPEALEQALAVWILKRWPTTQWQAAAKAKAILAGPLAPVLADLQRVTAERDEARNPFGASTPTVQRIALLMGQTWLEAVCDGGHIVGTVEEFAMVSPEDYAACCTVTKAVLAAVDPAKANERADTATAEAASLRADVEALVHAIDMAKAEITFAQQDEADGSSHASRRVRFRGILDALNGAGNPATRTALARAATAGEGRSDG